MPKSIGFKLVNNWYPKKFTSLHSAEDAHVLPDVVVLQDVVPLGGSVLRRQLGGGTVPKLVDVPSRELLDVLQVNEGEGRVIVVSGELKNGIKLVTKW